MARRVQSLYQLYVKHGNRWRWYCDLLTPTHREALARASKALALDPTFAEKPLRLEHVEDFPLPPPGDETAIQIVPG